MMYGYYRLLYGEDFAQESLLSIADACEKIFIFYATKPWAHVTSCVYKDQTIPLHYPFDAVLDKIQALQLPHVVLIEDSPLSNVNRVAWTVNRYIFGHYPQPDRLLCLEPDMVFGPGMLQAALEEFDQVCARQRVQVATTAQIEFWKTPGWRLPPRRRHSVIVWQTTSMARLPTTQRFADPAPLTGLHLHWLQSAVYNFGFCLSEAAMRTKHLLALAFSQRIGDSVPNAAWYEDVWLPWTPERQTYNLEISRGLEHTVPAAVPCPLPELPESLRHRFGI